MMGRSFVLTGNANLNVAMNKFPGISAVNKYGNTTNADSGVVTDIWDRANATNDQDIWVAPTQARVHAIVSASDEDSDTGGVVAQGDGARTLRVYGLTDWDTAETSEDITMDGTTAVNTSNSYVIIHRMRVLTNGGHASGPNVGLITATAATDGTVTAQINAAEGQTQMAIYGVPSIQTAYMEKYYASVIKAGAALTCAVTLKVNPEPDSQLTNFITKHTNGLDTAGNNYMPHEFKPPYSIPGPAIIKLQVNSSRDNSNVSGGFDMIIVNN